MPEAIVLTLTGWFYHFVEVGVRQQSAHENAHQLYKAVRGRWPKEDEPRPSDVDGAHSHVDLGPVVWDD